MKKQLALGVLLVVTIMILFSGCSSISYDEFVSEQEQKEEKETVQKNQINMNAAKEEEADQIIKETEKKAEQNAKRAKGTVKKKYEANYNKLIEDCSNMDNVEEYSFLEQGLLYYYRFYANLKMWGPVASVVSFLAGILLHIFAKGNKSLQKFGLYKLAILLPSVLLGSVLLLGIFNGMFLY